MNQLAALSLTDRLRLEASRRMQRGGFFQIPALSFLGYTYGFEPHQTTFFRIFITLAIFLVIVRGFGFYLVPKKYRNIKRQYYFHMFLSSCTALIYGLIVADTVHHYREFNSPVIMMLFFAIGLSTAVINALAPAPVFQRIYFFLSGAPITIAFFNAQLDPVFHHFGIVYILYMSYLIYCGNAITKDLVMAYKAEIHSREQKETLQKVIDLVPGFVALSDSAGAWATTSHSFEKYRNSHAFQEIVKQFRMGQNAQLTREITWYENGEENSYILSTQKFPDLSMIIVGIPASEIFEMRKELDLQRTKAEFSARLATLGEMAGGIAHEVNNPLAVIIGVCSQIALQIKQPEPDLPKIQEKIDKISKTSFRINKIITGLQSFSRQSDKDPFVATPLPQIIDDTFELCREKFHKNAIQLNIGEIPEVEIQVRAVQISQVLINLLNNAFDAVKKLQNPVVNVNFELTDDNVFIRVSDSGPGIPPPIAERIFDPFFTTKDVGQGTGLGLSISRSILLDHQGELQLLRSEKQTTFQLRLPRIRQETT